MLTPLIMFLMLSLLTTGLARLLNAEFEDVLPVAVMSAVFVLFVFGVFEKLTYGVAVLAVFCLAGLICFFGRKSVFRRCMKGIFLFMLVTVILTICNYGKKLYNWDEFSHWGTVVDQMVEFNVFGLSSKTRVLFRSYPPAMALFQYLVQKVNRAVYSNASFCEWQLYFAYQLFAFSLVFPILKRLSLKKIDSYLFLATLFISPVIFFEDFYKSILIDPFVGVAAGAGMAKIFTSEKKDKAYHLYIYEMIMILVLSKDSGILFALFISLTYVLSELSDILHSEGKNRFTGITTGKIFLAVFSVVIPKTIWNILIRRYGVIPSFSNKIDLSSLINVLLRRENSYRWDVIMNYSNYLVNESPMRAFETKFSYPVVFILLFVFLYYCFIRENKKDQTTARFRKNGFYVVLIQTIVYFAGMCIAYMYKFSEEEALKNASADRYLAVPLISVLMLSVLMFISSVDFSENRKLMAGLLLSGVLLTCPFDTLYYSINSYYARMTILHRSPYDELSRKVKKTLQRDSTLAVISQKSDGFDLYIFLYDLLPKEDDDFKINIPRDFSSVNTGQPYSLACTAEEMTQTLKKNYDYVLIYTLNEEFCSSMNNAFSEGSEILENALYKVDKESGKLTEVAFQKE